MGVQVRVANLNGPLCEVWAEPSCPIRQLKLDVERLTGIKVREQRLFLGLAELKSDEALASFLPRRVEEASAEDAGAGDVAAEDTADRGVDVALLRQQPEQAEWLEAVLQAGPFVCSMFSSAPESVRQDREVVLAAVRLNGLALQEASEDLRADWSLVHVAVLQSGWALRFAAEHLQADHELVLAAVRQNGLALGSVHAELQDDREIVMAAVHQDGHALQFASETLRADPEVVAAAVAQTPSAWQFASRELQAHHVQAQAAALRPRTAARYGGRCKFDVGQHGVVA